MLTDVNRGRGVKTIFPQGDGGNRYKNSNIYKNISFKGTMLLFPLLQSS